MLVVILLDSESPKWLKNTGDVILPVLCLFLPLKIKLDLKITLCKFEALEEMQPVCAGKLW